MDIKMIKAHSSFLPFTSRELLLLSNDKSKSNPVIGNNSSLYLKNKQISKSLLGSKYVVNFSSNNSAILQGSVQISKSNKQQNKQLNSKQKNKPVNSLNKQK